VRRFREQRGYRTQQALVDRLHELGATTTGWNQVKVHRLETGKTQRVTLEDLCELAMALDVSPLQLMTPGPTEGKPTQVWIGGKTARWPWDFRQWVRGVKPILHRGQYRTDADAERGVRFYLVDSQPLSEWKLIADAGKLATRAQASLAFLEPETEETVDAK
jgi:transcriptional regulator with XRE-family HTH domain